MSSSPESTRNSSKAGCSQSTSDTPFGEQLPLGSISSSNSPQTEESGLQPFILSIPQSQSTQQSSEAQDQIYNVVPSVSLSLPAVLIHCYDDPETTKDELKDSNKPNQSLHPQKDDFQLETLVQVPFEFGQPSLSEIPGTPHIQDEGMKDVKEKEDIEENEGTLEDMQESQNIEEDKTGTNFHMLEEAKQPPSSNEVNNTTEGMEELSLLKIQHTLKEGIQEQKVELVSLFRVETTKAVEVESTKMDDEETDVLVASCLSPSHLGPTRQNRETQSLLIQPMSDKLAIMQHRQEEVFILDPSVIDSVLLEDPKLDNQTISMCTSEHPTSKQEKPKLVSVSETSPTDFDLQPTSVHSLAEDDFTFQGDEDEPSTAPYQTCKNSETQHALPRTGTELSQISKDQTEVTLYTCLMASVTFFSAVICLAVGIQEPSIFLYVGLFLLSFWF